MLPCCFNNFEKFSPRKNCVWKKAWQWKYIRLKNNQTSDSNEQRIVSHFLGLVVQSEALQCAFVLQLIIVCCTPKQNNFWEYMSLILVLVHLIHKKMLKYVSEEILHMLQSHKTNNPSKLKCMCATSIICKADCTRTIQWQIFGAGWNAVWA